MVVLYAAIGSGEVLQPRGTTRTDLNEFRLRNDKGLENELFRATVRAMSGKSERMSTRQHGPAFHVSRIAAHYTVITLYCK